MHALVIEGDAIVAMSIEQELRDLGFNSVELACSEQEAVEAVSRQRPDLITSDGSLFAGRGARGIRRFRPSPSVPVIFITGDPEGARDCLPDAPVLEKPFSVTQLIAVVERAPCRGPHNVRRSAN